MSRTALALVVGLVCCVLLSSGLGAATVGDSGAGTAGQLDDDSTVSDDDTTVDETTDNTTETSNTTETVSETTDNTTETSNTTETVSETTDNTTETSGTTETVSETADDTTETSNTTDTVSETTENTTETTSGAANNTTDTVSETTDDTTDTVSQTTDDTTETVSETADNTTEAVGNTTGRADAQDIGNRSERAVAPTPESASAARATPERADAAASPDAGGGNATAAGGKARGLGGSVPSPDGKTAAVGVGAAVAAGAAGRAYVGSTSGAPQTVTGLARTGVPMVRSLPRLLLDRTWRYLGAAGYVLHSGDPLEHETRAELAGAVDDNPGAYLTELADATDASTSTVRYHLKVLEREGVLTPVKIRGKRRYFPADEPADELAAALADDATETVLRALASVGPASVSALAEELDRDPSTVTHHLDRLQEAGLVERERDGRSVSNSLAPAAAAAMTPQAGESGEPTAAGSSMGD